MDFAMSKDKNYYNATKVQLLFSLSTHSAFY